MKGIKGFQKGHQIWLGKHHTEKTKRKMSEVRKGNDNPFYGKHQSEETRRKISLANKGKDLGEKRWNWKGDNVGNGALHIWIKRRLPVPKYCQQCAKEAKLDLANVTGEYNRDFTNWMYLCRSCHQLYDFKIGVR